MSRVFSLQERAVRDGLTFVAPYDDPYTIAGQGTIGDEILRQVTQHLVVTALAACLSGRYTSWPADHCGKLLVTAL